MLKKISLFSTLLFVSFSFFIACNTDNLNEEKDLNSIINESPIPESSLVSLFGNDNSTQFKVAPKEIVSIDTGVLYVPPTTLCRHSGSVDYMNNQNLSFPKIVDAENDLYSLRDNELLSGETGILYINAFYEISNLLEDKNFNINELSTLSSILPKLRTSYNNLKDVNYKGVIIDQNLLDDIIDVMDLYRTKPSQDDTRYKGLIDAIEDDITVLLNRDRKQVLDYFKN